MKSEEEIIEIWRKMAKNKKTTIDDFFEAIGVAKENRSDFIFAAILNRILKKEKNERSRIKKDFGIERDNTCLLP